MRHRSGCRSRRRTAVLVAALLASVSAGCSGDPAPSGTDDPAAPTAAAGLHGRSGAQRGSPVGTPEFVATVSRSLDRATTARVALHVISPQATVSGHGTVDYTGPNPAVRLLLRVPSLGEGTIEARLVDDVFYVRLPMLDPTGTFFRVDFDDPGNPLGDDSGALGALDPRQAVRAFGSVVRRVRLVGTERLDGVVVRRYRVEADGIALTRLLGERGSVPGASAGAGVLPEVVACDVWLDRSDRVRRLSADLGPQGSLELRLHGWGAPVRIVPPPARRVEELPAG